MTENTTIGHYHPGLRILERLFTSLFVLALPLFLFTTNLRWAVNSPRLYEYGFNKNQVGASLGLVPEELSRIARELIRYFNSEEEGAVIWVNGQELFNEREKIHLQDVRGLIRLGYAVQWGALAYCLVFAVGGVFRYRRQLIWGVLWGSGATLALFLVLGLGIWAGFEQLFLGFHLISFRNPFWMLTYPPDRLIVLFQPGFFYDAALFLAIATILEALLLGGMAFLLRKTPRLATLSRR